jgi:hypothetical protein
MANAVSERKVNAKKIACIILTYHKGKVATTYDPDSTRGPVIKLLSAKSSTMDLDMLFQYTVELHTQNDGKNAKFLIDHKTEPQVFSFGDTDFNVFSIETRTPIQNENITYLSPNLLKAKRPYETIEVNEKYWLITPAFVKQIEIGKF